MKFLSEAALYLYKSTICPCMEYCCHVWASGPSCYLDLLDKLQNKYTGLLVLHLLLLLNPLLIIEMWAYIFSASTTLVDVLQNWLNWFHFFFPEGGLLIIPIDCMISLSPFLDVTTMSLSTIALLAQLYSAILSL